MRTRDNAGTRAQADPAGAAPGRQAVQEAGDQRGQSRGRCPEGTVCAAKGKEGTRAAATGGRGGGRETPVLAGLAGASL